MNVRSLLASAVSVLLLAACASDPAEPYIGVWHRPGQVHSTLIVERAGTAFVVRRENPPAWKGRDSTMTDHPSTFTDGALMMSGLTKVVYDDATDQLLVGTFGGSVRYSRVQK